MLGCVKRQVNQCKTRGSVIGMIGLDPSVQKARAARHTFTEARTIFPQIRPRHWLQNFFEDRASRWRLAPASHFSFAYWDSAPVCPSHSAPDCLAVSAAQKPRGNIANAVRSAKLCRVCYGALCWTRRDCVPGEKCYYRRLNSKRLIVSDTRK
jgi:hypothetical protein